MFTHSTLTQGEWVQVQHAGTQHDLKVLALRPAAAVSIIGMSLIAGCSVVALLLLWLGAQPETYTYAGNGCKLEGWMHH